MNISDCFSLTFWSGVCGSLSFFSLVGTLAFLVSSYQAWVSHKDDVLRKLIVAGFLSIVFSVSYGVVNASGKIESSVCGVRK